MFPKAALGFAAGVSGLLFVGYCVYFDHKRRSHPEFKTKLRNRRKEKRLAKSSHLRIPDASDSRAIQQYFFKQVEKGETLLSEGEVDAAVEHIGMAIAVCGHPEQLMQLLRQQLPPQVFSLLLQRLPMIGSTVARLKREQASASSRSQVNLETIDGLNSSLQGRMLSIEDELE